MSGARSEHSGAASDAGARAGRGGDLRIGLWRRGLSEQHRPAVRDLFARVREADGRGPEDLPGADAQVLLAERSGEPVGLAWRTGDDPAELVVDPPHRRQGVGAALAEQAGDRGVWAHGTLPAARALARSAGATPVRTMLQLRRDLTGPFQVQPPQGVRIRTFVPGADDEQFLAVNARAFAWHPEQGRLDGPGLREQMAQPWFDPKGFFLAVHGGDGDTVLGFHWTKVHPQDPTPQGGVTGPIGEVYVLAVDPESPIRGLGTVLTIAGLAHLAAQGLSTVMLYVESDNDPALRLYRRLGFDDFAADTVFARI